MKDVCVVIKDSDIIAVNLRRDENFQNTIDYQDTDKAMHTIVLDTCVQNWKQYHPASQHRCIGERDRSELYFLLYTSGYHTKIIFHKKFIFSNHILKGTREKRFFLFQKLLHDADYATYDLT